MTRSLSSILCFFVLLSLQPVQAHQVKCPVDLKWTDATHLERRTHVGGVTTVASVTVFSDATVDHLDAGGHSGSVILLNEDKYPGKINLTFGSPKPAPFYFAELGMIASPPMMDDSVRWHRFSSPCVLPESKTLKFDEFDSSEARQEHGDHKTRFHGIMIRRGYTIRYKMESEERSNSNRGRETWEGVWQYEPHPKSYPVDTDLRGWHVYRQNEFLLTLPTDMKVSLSSVIGRVGTLPDSH